MPSPLMLLSICNLCSIGFLLLLPWLNPIASGPTPSVYPWLASTICGAVIWVMRAKLTAPPIFGAWLLAALLSAVMGMLQYFGYAQIFDGWVRATDMGSAFANLRQRNQFATLINIGLVALVWWSLQRRATSDAATSNTWRGTFIVLGLLLLALGNASSSSRTGALQWCLILGLILWWSPKGSQRMIAVGAFGLTAYVLAVLALPAMLEMSSGTPSGGLLARFTEEPGCASRSVLWSNVLHLITQKPWFGWGWGELDYAHFTTLYPGERFCDILDNAHNLPLHLAVELGSARRLGLCRFAG